MALYDAVVIGTGFGGAVAAEAIAKAGKSVLVLEMGNEWALSNIQNISNRDEDGYPVPWADGLRRLEHAHDPKYIYSLFQDVWNNKLLAAGGIGVGGGSLIYSNIFETPPARIFDPAYGPQWPTGWDYTRLNSLIDRVLGVYDSQTETWTTPYKIYTHVPNYRPLRNLLTQYALESAYGPGVFPLARVTVRGGTYRCLDPSSPTTCISCLECRGRCRSCGFCTFGCIYGAKQSLNMNYIPRARSFGATILSEKMATKIRPYTGGGGNYRIYYKNSSTGQFVVGVRATGSTEYTVDAKVVVLAGGAMNTPALLLKSKNAGFLANLSAEVGYNLSGNGDYATGLHLPETFSLTINGKTINNTNFKAYKGIIMMGYTQPFTESEGICVEDLWGPPIGVAAKFPIRVHDPSWAESSSYFVNGKVTKWKNPSMYGARQKTDMATIAKRALGFAFFGEDGCDGRVYLDSNDEIAVSKPTLSKYNTYQSVITAMKNQLPSGTRYVETVIERQNMDYYVSCHSLSTCRMADSINDGVCDGNGQVFNYPNMYICDGSVIPRATIVNPALTITAVCEGIADSIVANFPT
jgi:cholesterol oxidase